jgi:hypothetical protein
MFNLKRLAFALSPVLAAGVIAAVAMSTTAPGAAALRNAASKLSINAEAAGGGGGGGGRVDGLTVSDASLVAHLALNLTVTYVCRPVFDPNTGGFDVFMSSSVYATVQERTGKETANGFGFGNGTAICDEGLTPTPTVNTTTVLVSPAIYPSASPPFKNGTALATVNVFACPNTFVASGVPPPCDFGFLGPTVISIK